jgi:hypothetical protein
MAPGHARAKAGVHIVIAAETGMVGSRQPLSDRLALGHDRRFALAGRAAAQRGSHAEHRDSGHHNNDKLPHLIPQCLHARTRY